MGDYFTTLPFLLTCRCVGIEYVNMENTAIYREGNKYEYHPVLGISQFVWTGDYHFYMGITRLPVRNMAVCA